MDTQEAIERRKAQNAKHNPWDRLSQAERDAQLAIQGCRPIRWTTDPTLVNTVTEDGYVYVYAGGPTEGSASAEPRKRADGKVDGRSKGVRKCGRCGETGHNARTCKGPVAPKVEAAPKSVPAPKAPEPKAAPESEASGQGSNGLPAARPPVRGDAPAPRKVAERPEMRASVKVPGKKTCGKCGGVGHNARTCGKGSGEASKGRAKVKHSKAPGKTGRQNTCGKCGGKGHNARTCKG